MRECWFITSIGDIDKKTDWKNPVCYYQYAQGEISNYNSLNWKIKEQGDLFWNYLASPIYLLVVNQKLYQLHLRPY